MQVSFDAKKAGEIIKDARNDKKLTQKDVGVACDRDSQYIYLIEHGKRTVIDTYITIALFLGIPVNDLFPL